MKFFRLCKFIVIAIVLHWNQSLFSQEDIAQEQFETNIEAVDSVVLPTYWEQFQVRFRLSEEELLDYKNYKVSYKKKIKQATKDDKKILKTQFKEHIDSLIGHRALIFFNNEWRNPYSNYHLKKTLKVNREQFRQIKLIIKDYHKKRRAFPKNNAKTLEMKRLELDRQKNTKEHLSEQQVIIFDTLIGLWKEKKLVPRLRR